MSKLSHNLEYILTKEQLENDYRELGTLSKIAKKYSVGTSTVSKRFVKLGIPFDKTPHRYENNHDFFANETEPVFYLAGFIAADGCIRIAKTNKTRNHINHRLVIALAEKDRDFLEHLRLTIGSENPIATYIVKMSARNPKWKDSWICKLSITSKKMVEDLQRFGIGPRKSLTYAMPEWLENHHLVKHFLRGFVDGDGSFWIGQQPEKTNITFSLRGTLPFLEQFKKTLSSNCALDTKSSPRMEGGIGSFSVHSNIMVSKIFDYLYRDAEIYLPRKYAIAKKAGDVLSIQERADALIKSILHEDHVEIITDRSAL